MGREPQAIRDSDIESRSKPKNWRDIRKRISAVNKLTASPDQRAYQVFNLLKNAHPEFDEWDILCFCNEFLTGLAGSKYEWLKEPVRKLNSLVYTAHYHYPKELGLIDEQTELILED